jgi:hypothetical protein
MAFTQVVFWFCLKKLMKPPPPSFLWSAFIEILCQHVSILKQFQKMHHFTASAAARYDI